MLHPCVHVRERKRERNRKRERESKRAREQESKREREREQERDRERETFVSKMSSVELFQYFRNCLHFVLEFVSLLTGTVFMYHP